MNTMQPAASVQPICCAYCGCRGPMTRDHIIPRRTGAGYLLHGDVRNWKFACLQCNNYRDHADDCPAVVTLARGVARDARMKTRHVLAAWGFIHSKARQAYRMEQLQGRLAQMGATP